MKLVSIAVLLRIYLDRITEFILLFVQFTFVH